MNTLKKIGIVAAFACMCGAAMPADAQIYVKIRPPRPHVTVKVRPVRPNPTAVWIEDDWRPGNGRYDYNGGRWETPPRRGMTWRPGQWKNTPRRGYVWVPGKWVSKRYY